MTDLILSLIGAAWQIGAAGFLAAVLASLTYLQFFHTDHSAYIVCHDCGGREDTDCSTCGGMGQIDDDGDAWDRARDIEQDRRWEIAS